MRSLCLAAALLLPVLPAAAQTIRGVGARPCADWLQARKGGGRDFEAEQWALGYLSAVNVAQRGSGLFHGLDAGGIFAGIDSYCGGHPGDMLWNAVKAVTPASRGA